MNIQPLNDLVLLRLLEAEEQTKGGIIVPASAREQPAEGLVEAMAADATDEVAIGDIVLYKKYSGEEISIEGVKHRLVAAGDLLAKYVETDEIPD